MATAGAKGSRPERTSRAKTLGSALIARSTAQELVNRIRHVRTLLCNLRLDEEQATGGNQPLGGANTGGNVWWGVPRRGSARGTWVLRICQLHHITHE